MPKGKKPIPEAAGGSAGDSAKAGGREKDDGESLLESVLRASTLSGKIDQNVLVIIFFLPLLKIFNNNIFYYFFTTK